MDGAAQSRIQECGGDTPMHHTDGAVMPFIRLAGEGGFAFAGFGAAHVDQLHNRGQRKLPTGDLLQEINALHTEGGLRNDSWILPCDIQTAVVAHESPMMCLSKSCSNSKCRCARFSDY